MTGLHGVALAGGFAYRAKTTATSIEHAEPSNAAFLHVAGRYAGPCFAVRACRQAHGSAQAPRNCLWAALDRSQVAFEPLRGLDGE
jgi:hypothetical protein